ncbi:MAG TPA: L-histidine N(alpha)-methyltransferase [Burkholderiaceae bacterium]|nr:L-histidine N(alpha)-methyltransferase [Burkholderiaceae bacterium]
MTTPRFVQLHREDSAALRLELAQSLRGEPASVSPKFLYDALGSRLFDAITELPEYYPTRVERTIFSRHASTMAAIAGRGRTLIDLGAGNCEKAARLFDVLAPLRYVAVDISVDYLRESLASLQRQYPSIEMVGVGADFSAALTLPPEAGRGERLLFYPGSSIGNFAPRDALRFLGQARAVGGPGGALLIGVDLVKPKPILELAYDDPLQVTAAFNLNLLRRLNTMLGCDARIEDFKHVALFNERESRIEMHLQARRALTLRWTDGERALAAGERIHTENSYKYTVEGFGGLLREAGFSRTTHWTDEQHWFAVFLATA